MEGRGKSIVLIVEKILKNIEKKFLEKIVQNLWKNWE